MSCQDWDNSYLSAVQYKIYRNSFLIETQLVHVYAEALTSFLWSREFGVFVSVQRFVKLWVLRTLPPWWQRVKKWTGVKSLTFLSSAYVVSPGPTSRKLFFFLSVFLSFILYPIFGEALGDLGEVNWRRPWRTRRGRRPTLGLGASGKWMITIIHLPEGSTSSLQDSVRWNFPLKFTMGWPALG